MSKSFSILLVRVQLSWRIKVKIAWIKRNSARISRMYLYCHSHFWKKKKIKLVFPYPLLPASLHWGMYDTILPEHSPVQGPRLSIQGNTLMKPGRTKVYLKSNQHTYKMKLSLTYRQMRGLTQRTQNSTSVIQDKNKIVQC